MSGAQAERHWWQTRWFAVVAVLLVAAPLLWPAFPPFTDIPGHLGRYRVLLDGGSGPLAQWFTPRWQPIGNMGADLLVMAFGPFLGLEPAVKLIAMLAAGGTAAACLWLSRVAHGRLSPFAIAALPLAYNHPFNTGFLNFALGMALAIAGLALWLRLQDWRWRGPLFVPIALVVWLTHTFGWGVLGLTVFAAQWSRAPRRPIAAGLACWPFLAPLPLMLLWRAARGGDTFAFFDWPSKAIWILTALRDRWFEWDVPALIVVLALIGFGIASKSVRVSRPLAWATVALFAAFLIIPGWLFGSAFADMRAAPYVLIYALVMLRPAQDASPRFVATLALIAIAFTGLRLAGTSVSLALYDAQFRRELVALDHIPTGTRVASLASRDCDAMRVSHLGSMAIARRRAFANDQWLDVGASLMAIHHPAAGAYATDPAQLLPCDSGRSLPAKIADLPQDAFDFLWLIDVPVAPPQRIAGMTMVWHDGASALYRIDHPRN